MKTLTILFILTSQAVIGDTQKPTGVWMEELTTPYYAFIDAGFKVEIASIKGGKIPIDPRSQKKLGENPPSVDRFLKDENAMKSIQASTSIDTIEASQYAAIFLPGGHGTMFDFPNNKKLASIISDTLKDNRIVAAVCHGPAGLLSAKDTNQTPIVQDKRIAAFTNDEEDAVGLTDDMPFLLETRLRELGANVITAPTFEAHAIEDGNLITGQNPASSDVVAKLVIKKLQNR